MKANEQFHKCDVLVIGGGLAGCYAAIRAGDFASDVILVDKAKVSRSGASTFAAGVILGPTVGDNLDLWLKEIAERGEYLSDQDWVKVLLEDQIERIREMDSWGVPFEKDEKGSLARIIGRGHTHTRLHMFHGKKLMETMRKKLLDKRVTLVERVMITDLLTADGQHPTKLGVIGAVGFGTRTGEWHIFESGATVLATAGISFKGSSFEDNTTGDGIAQAYRAGAELSGMESRSARGGWCFEHKYYIAGMNMYQNAGIIMTNAKGERFMAKYFPELKERARLQDMLLAFTKEGYEGRGPIYVDMRHFDQATLDRFRKVLPIHMQAFDRAGIDITKQKLIFDLPSGTIRGPCCGGIRNNIYCETNLPGLYAAGSAGGFPTHGVYSIGGVNLATCCVSGHRAGEYAARYAKQAERREINQSQLEQLQESASTPLRVKDGVTADGVAKTLQDLISPAENSIFRHEKRMRKVLSRLEDIRTLSSRLSVPDAHELVKANETKNYIQCLELVFAAALVRTESRGEHIREDYPYRDDVNWLKWIVMHSDNGGNAVRLVPIPIYRYPAKPERYEKVPLPVPLPKIETSLQKGGVS